MCSLANRSRSISACLLWTGCCFPFSDLFLRLDRVRTWRRVIFQMVDRGLDEYFQVLDLFEGDLVRFGTLILYFSERQDLLSGL